MCGRIALEAKTGRVWGHSSGDTEVWGHRSGDRERQGLGTERGRVWLPSSADRGRVWLPHWGPQQRGMCSLRTALAEASGMP